MNNSLLDINNPILSVEPSSDVTEAAELGLDSGDLHHRTFQNESIAAMGLFAEDFETGIPDPDFNKSEAKKRIPNTIHPRFRQSLLDKAVSDKHFDALLPDFELDSAQERYLDSLPWYKNIGYNILPELSNAPLYIAAAYAMPATAATLGSTALTAGLTAGLADVGVEGLKDIIGTHDKEAIDYGAAFIIGGAVGSIFGRTKNLYYEAAEQEIKDIAGITPEVEAKLLKADNVDEKKEILRESYEAANLDKLSESGYEQLDRLAQRKGFAERLWEAGRQDIAHAGHSSKSPLIQEFSKAMFPDPTLQRQARDFRDYQTMRDRAESQIEGEMISKLTPLVNEFSKILKKRMFMGRPVGSSYDEFGSLVGFVRNRRSIDESANIDDLIDKAMAKYGYEEPGLKDIIKRGVLAGDDIYTKIADIAKEIGNIQFNKGIVKPNPMHSHFTYDKSAITRLINEGVRKEDIQTFFANAMRSFHTKAYPNSEVNEELLRKAAVSFYHGVSESKMDTSGTIKDLLKEIADSVKTPEEKAFFNKMINKPEAKDVTTSSPFKGRSAIDYAFVDTLTGNKGKKIEFSVADLLDDNFYSSTRKYHRKTLGSSALHNHKWTSKRKFITPEDVELSVLQDPEVKELLQKKATIDELKNKLATTQAQIDEFFNRLRGTELGQDMVDIISNEIDNFVPASKNRLDYQTPHGIVSMSKKEFQQLGVIARKTKAGKPLTKEQGETAFKHADYLDENVDDLINSKADDFEPNIVAENQLDISKKEMQEAKRFIQGEKQYEQSFNSFIDALKGRYLEQGGDIDKLIGSLPFKADDFKIGRDFIESASKEIGDYLNVDKNLDDLMQVKRQEIIDANNIEKVIGDEKSAIISEGISLWRKIAKLKDKLTPQKDKAKLTKEINDIEASLLARKAKLVKVLGDSVGNNIFNSIKQVADNYMIAGRKAYDDAIEAYKKQYNTDKVHVESDAFKAIHEGIKKRNTVDTRQADEAIREAVESSKYEERVLHTDKDIQDFMESNKAELQGMVDSGEMTLVDMKKELTLTEFVLKDMHGVPTAKDPNGNWAKAQRVMAAFNIFRLLASSGFSMAAEGASAIIDFGMRNLFKSLPTLGSVLKAYRTGTITNKTASELQEFLGLFDETLSSPRAFELSHEYSPSITKTEKFLDKAQSAMEHMAEFTLMIGGIKPLTAWFKAASALGMFDEFRVIAKGGKASKRYKRIVHELGLSNETLEKIIRETQKHADDETMNFGKWDREVRDLLLDGIKRRGDTVVQQKRLGDTMKWINGESDYLLQSTVPGKILLELKTFMLVSYTKQLGRVVTRKDAYSAMLIAAWGTALSLSYMAKTSLAYAGNEKKRKEMLEPEKMIPSVISMMPLASIFPDIIDFGTYAATGESPFGKQRHSNIVANLLSQFPAADGIEKVFSSFSKPFRDAYQDEVDIHSFTPAMKATGFKNNWITRPFAEELIER